MGLRGWMRAALAVAAVSVLPAVGWAQMHAVKKPETVVRAVGVYEWTGELAKPTASRLIPVTIFIDGHLEDAGVYLARPVPMALDTGTVFELDDAGRPKGLLDLAFARHLQPAETSTVAPYDDGWFGYGQYKALAAPKLTVAKGKVRQSKATLESSKADTAKPHLSSKTDKPDKPDTTDAAAKSPAGTDAGSSSTASADPDRPTMRRRDDTSGTASGSSSQTSQTSQTAAKDTPPADPDRPTMKRRTDDTSGDSSASSTPSGSGKTGTPSSTSSVDDADRPTMKRRTDSDSGGSSSASSTPADDPDRPVLKRKSSSSDDSSTASTDSSKTDSSKTDSSKTDDKADQKTDTDTDADRPTMKRRTDAGSDSTASGSTPADDPDRPTLKKRTPAERKAAQKASAEASVSGVGSLNDDPNRPSLHRGKPTHSMTEDDLPKMIGLPPDLKQMVAVSDAVNRPEHDFARPWESAAEHEEVLGRMRALAVAKLLEYAPLPPAAAVKPVAVARTAAARAAVARAAAKKKTGGGTPVVELKDEVLKAYVLSYGGAATYAFSASFTPATPAAAATGTATTLPAVRYVTVLAQADANGELKLALSNVTDARHLDRTPRMRLVDVVDAEASNRASLLFELRAQGSRSFTLYRLIGAEAEQTFSTGSTQ